MHTQRHIDTHTQAHILVQLTMYTNYTYSAQNSFRKCPIETSGQNNI